MFNLLAVGWLELASLVIFLSLLACFTMVWFGCLSCCLAFVCFAVLGLPVLLFDALICDALSGMFHLVWRGLSPIGLV